MKKLLVLLGSVGLIATPISTVMSCSTKRWSEKEVYDKMLEIASEPIEYNDSFLIDYEADETIVKDMLDTMIFYYKTSTNLINQLLTKIIYEKVLTKMPNIKEIYPNFTLRTERKLEGDIDQEMDNLFHNRKFTINYLIFYNLHSLDEIKYFTDTSGANYVWSDSNLPSFSEGFHALYQHGEYLISNVEHQTFSFTQKRFISDPQERLDFYMSLYQPGGAVKPFAWDSINSLNMFSIAEISYKKNNLPVTVITKIKTNAPEKETYLKIIENYIKNKWIQYNHVEILHFPELNLIDSFETNLTFDSAYTAPEIRNNEKLNHVFGTRDGHVGSNPGFYNGVLIFNLEIKAKLKNQTSQQKNNEKLYVHITNDLIF